jgi:hypothetical protein
MEATCYPEMLVDFQRTTRRYISELFITIAVTTSNPTQFNLITSVLKAVIVTNTLDEISPFFSGLCLFLALVPLCVSNFRLLEFWTLYVDVSEAGLNVFFPYNGIIYCTLTPLDMLY